MKNNLLSGAHFTGRRKCVRCGYSNRIDMSTIRHGDCNARMDRKNSLRRKANHRTRSGIVVEGVSVVSRVAQWSLCVEVGIYA